ncbi:zinc-ribbon domain-containing protein [Bacteroides salyersiae]|uniref:zinc-ribbon domain-containing protein n=1 Tax=Bacteroides salyersiae TaxID=291644 RepID=UPI001C8C67BA
MSIKRCPNPECRADNLANAKFCRKCGTAFTPANRYKQMISSAISNVFYSSIVRFNCSIFKFSNIGNYTRNGASL